MWGQLELEETKHEIRLFILFGSSLSSAQEGRRCDLREDLKMYRIDGRVAVFILFGIVVLASVNFGQPRARRVRQTAEADEVQTPDTLTAPSIEPMAELSTFVPSMRKKKSKVPTIKGGSPFNPVRFNPAPLEPASEPKDEATQPSVEKTRKDSLVQEKEEANDTRQPPPARGNAKSRSIQLNISDVAQRCAKRPLTNLSQCSCVYNCIRWGGFYLMRIYKATKLQWGPEERFANIFGPTMRNFSKSWPEPGVAVDIGANDGQDVPVWWSNFAPRSEGERAGEHFFLFEPQDQYVSNLSATIHEQQTKFQGTKGYHIPGGAGTPEQHGKMFYLVGTGFTARLVEETDPAVAARIASNTADSIPQVKIFSVERTLADHGLAKSNITFLKVDAEGADSTILHGSLNLFKTKRVQIGVMELHGSFEKKFPIQHPQVVEEIRDCGYRIFMFGLAGNRPMLTEMPVGATTYWYPGIDTLVFVLESSGLLGLAGLEAETLSTDQRRETLQHWAKFNDRGRVKDCADITGSEDFAGFCFKDILRFPMSGGSVRRSRKGVPYM